MRVYNRIEKVCTKNSTMVGAASSQTSTARSRRAACTMRRHPPMRRATISIMSTMPTACNPTEPQATPFRPSRGKGPQPKASAAATGMPIALMKMVTNKGVRASPVARRTPLPIKTGPYTTRESSMMRRYPSPCCTTSGSPPSRRMIGAAKYQTGISRTRERSNPSRPASRA